jgi:putative pyruvate formate lyase activating enzyme
LASYVSMPREKIEGRAKRAAAVLERCTLCPRECGVNRLFGEKGFCRGGKLAKIYSFAPHFGEEAPLVGTQGSGTIFFSGCNLSCLYCQNYEISQLDQGTEVSAQELAGIMLYLQREGCNNINFVTPTHFVPQILEALAIAKDNGVNMPLVYNCGGYESVETLKLLEGIFDIYMPDIKYGSDQAGLKYSLAKDYFSRAKDAIREMHRQVGDLQIENGLAKQGLLVRHLVLPESLAGTKEVIQFLSELSDKTYLNVMSQYHPAHRACDNHEISRRITSQEYAKAINMARGAGLDRGLEDY